MKVLNYGSLNLDYVYQVAHFVQPGETLSALSQAVNCGGKGLNQSISLAKAGAEIYHGGCLGAGGDLLAAELEKNGVDLTWLRKVDTLQGNAVIQVNREGENCILLFGGSNRVNTEEQIRETIGAFDAGDYLILQNEVNDLPLLIDAAYEHGMKVVLNPSPFEDSLKNLDYHKLTWILVNEIEAAQMTGETEPEKVRRYYEEHFPELSVVLTIGKGGAYCFAGGEEYFHPAFTVKAVDTTAAGDTFTGYFLVTMMNTGDPALALKKASAASAIAVTRPGAAVSIPMPDEVEAFLAERTE